LNVRKQTPIFFAAALSVLTAGAACSSDRGAEPGDANRPAGGSGDALTVSGCLSSGNDGRFVLTAAPDPGVTTAARPGMGERDTYSYVLVGGSNLQSHLGKRVEVSGTLVGREQELDLEAKTRSEATPTGTSGRQDTPTVTTKEEVDVEVRQLSVRDVREIAPTCQVNP
jgi:hypothetical protein